MRTRFLKVLGICLCVSISISLFTTYSNGQFGYQLPGLPYENQATYSPYSYSDFFNWSNWNWTSPTTAYNPNPASGGGIHLFVSYPEGGAWQSPYYQQSVYNPWNQPYNYGWNMPFSYGWDMPHVNLWDQPFNYWNLPFNQGWNLPYIYNQNPYTPTSASTSNIGNEEYLVYSAIIDEDDLISNKTLVWNLPTASYYSTLLDSIEGLERETIDDFFGKSTKQYTLKDNFTFDGNYELDSDGSIDKYFSRVGFNSDKDQALVYVKFGRYGMSIVFLTKEDGAWKAVDSYTVAIS